MYIVQANTDALVCDIPIFILVVGRYNNRLTYYVHILSKLNLVSSGRYGDIYAVCKTILEYFYSL